jgi:hypothetical protein
MKPAAVAACTNRGSTVDADADDGDEGREVIPETDASSSTSSAVRVRQWVVNAASKVANGRAGVG